MGKDVWLLSSGEDLAHRINYGIIMSEGSSLEDYEWDLK